MAEEPVISKLLGRKIVRDCGNFVIVDIPGFPELSIAQKRGLLPGLLTGIQDEEYHSPRLDADALRNALNQLRSESTTALPTPARSQSVTSTASFDSEQAIEDARIEENQARKFLLEDGCPPCYSTDYEYPFGGIPEEYMQSVSYFQSGGERVLPMQLRDWQAFRRWQDNSRRRYAGGKKFANYQEKLRQRRRTDGLEWDVGLHLDPRHQGRGDTWIEFQSYHLFRHDRLEKNLKKIRENLIAEQQKLEEKGEGREVDIFQYRVMVAESAIRRHNGLMQWIERQRMAMVAVAKQEASSIHHSGGLDSPGLTTSQDFSLQWSSRPCSGANGRCARQDCKDHRGGEKDRLSDRETKTVCPQNERAKRKHEADHDEQCPKRHRNPSRPTMSMSDRGEMTNAARRVWNEAHELKDKRAVVRSDQVLQFVRPLCRSSRIAERQRRLLAAANPSVSPRLRSRNPAPSRAGDEDLRRR